MDEYEANSFPTRSRSRASGCTAIWSRLSSIFALCRRQGILHPLIKGFTLTGVGLVTPRIACCGMGCGVVLPTQIGEPSTTATHLTAGIRMIMGFDQS